MVTSQAQHSSNEGVLRSNSAGSMLISDDLRLLRQGIEPRPSGFRDIVSTARPLPLPSHIELDEYIIHDKKGEFCVRLCCMRIKSELNKIFGSLSCIDFCYRDIAPEGQDLKEFQKNLDELTDYALILQQATGIKPLWATCNLFSNPR